MTSRLLTYVMSRARTRRAWPHVVSLTWCHEHDEYACENMHALDVHDVTSTWCHEHDEYACENMHALDVHDVTHYYKIKYIHVKDVSFCNSHNGQAFNVTYAWLRFITHSTSRAWHATSLVIDCFPSKVRGARTGLLQWRRGRRERGQLHGGNRYVIMSIQFTFWETSFNRAKQKWCNLGHTSLLEVKSL